MNFTEQDKKCLEALQEVLRTVPDSMSQIKPLIKTLIDDYLIEKSGLVDTCIKDDPDFNYYQSDFGNYCESVCINKIDRFMKSYTNTILYDMSERLRRAGYVYSYTHVDDNGKKCVKTILENHPYNEILFYNSAEVNKFIEENPLEIPF